VWAHPDDEAYLSAGLMAAVRDQGGRVVVACATRGEAGTGDADAWTPARLAALRRHELIASLAVGDVREHSWLGFRDGLCAETLAETGEAAIEDVIREVAPDTIITFGPDGMTGHSDHRTISAWTTAAWRRAGQPGRLWYATQSSRFHDRWGELNDRVGIWTYGEPPRTADEDLAFELCLTGAALDRKLVALRAHASQISPLVSAVGEDTFREWWSTESFVEAAR